MCVTWARWGTCEGRHSLCSAQHGTTGPGVSTAPMNLPGGNVRKVSARNVELSRVLNGLGNKVSSKISTQTAELKQLCITRPKRDTNGRKHVQSVCGYKLRRFVLGPRTTAHQQTTYGVALLCLHVDHSMRSA